MRRRFPAPATSPIPKILQREFAKELAKLSERAKERIEFLLSTSTLNEGIIKEIEEVLNQELGAEVAKSIIERYTNVFYERGADFAERTLKRFGIEIKIPSSMFAVLDNETLNTLENIQLDLLKSLNDEQKKLIALKLREGLLAGKSNREIVKEVLAVVDDTKWKIERIVRTESSRIFNISAANRYEKAGIKKWQWLTALDERVCMTCAEKHGKIITDRSQLPPHASHPNCRCTIVPVIETELEAEKVEEKEKPKEPITGDKELDERIYRSLEEFEDYLRKEGNFSRALNRFIYGQPIDSDTAEKLGKEYLKHFSVRDETVTSYIVNVSPYRIPAKLMDKVERLPIRIVNTKSYRGIYDPVKKLIKISTISEDRGETFMHELGHYFEFEVIGEDARKFYLARVKKHGFKLEPLNKHEKYWFVKNVYHYDGFDHVDPYCGVVYLSKWKNEHYKRLYRLLKDPTLLEKDPEILKEFTTEFLSKGFGFFAREEGMKYLYEKDKEYFGFMLSTLKKFK